MLIAFGTAARVWEQQQYRGRNNDERRKSIYLVGRWELQHCLVCSSKGNGRYCTTIQHVLFLDVDITRIGSDGGDGKDQTEYKSREKMPFSHIVCTGPLGVELVLGN